MHHEDRSLLLCFVLFVSFVVKERFRVDARPRHNRSPAQSPDQSVHIIPSLGFRHTHQAMVGQFRIIGGQG